MSTDLANITTDRAAPNGRPVSAVGEERAVDYLLLLKPRVMSLVIFTALCAMLVAPAAVAPHPFLAFVGLLCIAIGAGASGALNMWYEAEIDARMARTLNRPIPAGRVSRDSALNLGIGLSIGAVVTMGLFVNHLSAALLAFTILFYAVVYTVWLKPRTPQNIVIGGAAGALPPMIGWAVMTGEISAMSLILFGIIFIWTPPHFWALSLWRSGDYAKVGIPMLPVVRGEAETRRQIFLYSLALAPLGALPWMLGLADVLYGAVSIVLGGIFLALAARVWRGTGTRNAVQLFAFSIAYLFLLFCALVADHIILGAA